jgi:spore coat polysaccharide biosynthesis predicted glycosyltransferase SpsG
MTNILFRYDAFPEIGMDYITGCLALADNLHEVHSCRISFAMRTGPLEIKMVEEKGYQVLRA